MALFTTPKLLFEWLHWFAYPIVGLAADEYLLWIYPVLMWLFLYYVTGIPFSEKQAIKSRGQNYLDYQHRTSMFIPRRPKNRCLYGFYCSSVSKNC